MTLPGSAADSPKKKESAIPENDILIVIKGEPVTVSRSEAYAIASRLIISLQVSDERR